MENTVIGQDIVTRIVDNFAGINRDYGIPGEYQYETYAGSGSYTPTVNNDRYSKWAPLKETYKSSRSQYPTIEYMNYDQFVEIYGEPDFWVPEIDLEPFPEDSFLGDFGPHTPGMPMWNDREIAAKYRRTMDAQSRINQTRNEAIELGLDVALDLATAGASSALRGGRFGNFGGKITGKADDFFKWIDDAMKGKKGMRSWDNIVTKWDDIFDPVYPDLYPGIGTPPGTPAYLGPGMNIEVADFLKWLRAYQYPYDE